MKLTLFNSRTLLFCLCIFVFSAAKAQSETPDSETTSNPKPKSAWCFVVPDNVPVRNFFAYMDSVVGFLNNLLPYELTEHLFVRANPWLIERLENTDYYRVKAETGASVYDQGGMLALRAGDTLHIPDDDEASALLFLQKNTFLDVNIPEFLLRVVENGDTVFSCSIRVGKNIDRFMTPVGRVADLRTKTGKGEIAALHREVEHIDPVTGEIFTHTKRDDDITTLMPVIPWVEPRINGQLHGQWIHPTTNPRTLGQAYSNGCMGTREADMWKIYYYSPIGTPIFIRYDLEIKDENDDKIHLRDIYKREEQPEAALEVEVGEGKEGGGR